MKFFLHILTFALMVITIVSGNPEPCMNPGYNISMFFGSDCTKEYTDSITVSHGWGTSCFQAERLMRSYKVTGCGLKTTAYRSRICTGEDPNSGPSWAVTDSNCHNVDYYAIQVDRDSTLQGHG
ncbi:hypothetical protein GGR57DRAFT_499929 [Xylariaceae sp. FL1272]|nr:hypothetical protein GGR57DRAFT_499929 [Xylariaceae sp. FL1272]